MRLIICLATLLAMSVAVGAEWVNTVAKDAMTDFESSVWRREADNTIADTLGLMRTKPVLIIRCKDDKTELFIAWQRFITSGGLSNKHEARFRIGNEAPTTAQWGLSTNFEAMFAERPITLLRAMKGHNRFIIETTPYGSSPVRAEFNLSGVDDVIDDVARRCSWAP